MDQQLERALSEAQSAQQAGQPQLARDRLAILLARWPGEARAHNMLGMISLGLGEPGEAQIQFRAAIASDPDEPALHINLATACRQAKDDAGELQALDGAIELDQRHIIAWLRKAELHERRGEDAQGMQAWGAFVALCGQSGANSPQIDERLEHARSWLSDKNATFANAIDDALSPDRAALDAVARRRFDASIDAMLGRRRIYANHCEGMHYPFLPADEYFDRGHFPWLEELEAEAPAIRAELMGLLAEGNSVLEPYVQQKPGTPPNIWSELDHSLDWGVHFLWNYGRKNEEACARCPRTAAALERIPRIDLPGRAPTAFFSILAPGKHIPPHTGVTNTRGIVHLALIVPEGCRFRVGGETREWVEGTAFVFDDTIEHEAWNESNELRAVLIFDVWNPYINDDERKMIRQFFETADSTGFNPGTDMSR